MRALVLSATLAMSAVAVSAKPVTFDMPEEVVPAELADEAGEPVVAACSTCHSLEYITTQPRGKGAQFWRDAVAKMINVYKAPIEPADADAVAEVLAMRFG
ncbi:cytochrome C [Novosphingobium sp. ERN07]|uniref:SorB family sulfite dehydrogenase c-type cytochrome subunit n=1 Tax=Novosphingobium sp. ERN07 TaxID=2726187 RepID=UPI0014564930|nr:cytochrome C [Novosphingobium sp. ERN07]NLR70985.1 cytochrome C [Novosphingobium sp. ERN07]